MFAVKKTVLPNGVRVISQDVPHAFSVAFSLWWAVGSRDENDTNSGINHFLEHMAFKGTSHRSTLDIARQIDRLGGHANAFTSKEHTCFHGRALAASLEEMVDLFVDISLNPSLDGDELERERGVILQEIAGMEDTPDDLAFVLLQEDFWAKHPLGFSILGQPEIIESLRTEDMRRYIADYHVPSRLVITAVGNIEHQKFVDMLSPRLHALPSSEMLIERKVPTPNFGARAVLRDTEQEHLVIAAPGLPANHKGRMILALLNLILGGNMSSRLFQEVRERRGLAYSVYSFLHLQEDSGMCGIYLGVPPERANEALTVVRNELERLRSDPVSEQELADAKQSLKGGILLAAENMESKAARLARNEFTFGRHIGLREVLACLETVDIKDLGTLAQELLNPTCLRLLALGPSRLEELNWN